MIIPTRIRELDILVDADGTRRSHISAASGLVGTESAIYVVADDELHLGVFPVVPSAPGRLLRLFDGVLPGDKVGRKRRKPDLEALAFLPAGESCPHGALLALGSGSTPNRRRAIMLELDPIGRVSGTPRKLDMSPILGPIGDHFAEPNLEGAVIVGDELRMFQRGHRQQPDNAIIRFPSKQTMDALQGRGPARVEPIAIDRPKLPSVQGVPLCFTDAAVLPGGETVFCAVAEDTWDVYNDGACIAAGVGVVGKNGRLLSFEHLDRPYKVEGIDVRVENDRVELLLVTDADDPAIPAILLSATL